MTLKPATLGGFGVYPQVSKGTAPSGAEYYWFRANQVDVGVQQIVKEIGQLVGGTMLPGGSIKTGVFSGGRLVMPPPMDDYFGWLLYGMAGDVDSEAHGTYSGMYKHYFPSKTAGDATAPEKLLAMHKYIPTSDATYDLGEQVLDQTIARMQLAVAGGEYVTTQMDFIGRVPTPHQVTRATPEQGWVVTTKGKDSVPIAAKGIFQLPDGAAIDNAQGWSLDLVNITPGVRDVMVVGSYYPHSFPVTGRVIVINWSALFEASTLYQSMFYNAGAWNPVIYNTSFRARVESPGDADAEVDNEDGALSYTTEGADLSFTDAGQDFAAWKAAAAPALYWIKVTNSDGTTNSAYLGAGVGAGPTYTEIKVYKDSALTVSGWNGPGSSGKTPSSYSIYPALPYSLEFYASAVDWTATPIVLSGGELIRLAVTGAVIDVPGTSGVDWQMVLTNKTADYTWPT